MPLNRGMSKAKNLAKFMSFMAFKINADSGIYFYFLLRLPAATNTLLTALIP
jgi:hypothetical protein